jgi:isoleucyl-tRNA synthetase
MLEIDRYAIALVSQFQADALAQYERYEFHPVVAKLQTFCSEDLGSFYLDILKDRLYTSGTASRARRSAQTALWHILNSLLRLMAPFLSFTAEEAFKVFVRNPDATIFTELYHELPPVAGHEALLAKWSRIRAVRAEALKNIEVMRETGRLGSSLQAEIDVYASGDRYAMLATLGDELRFVTITSRATLHRVDDESSQRIEVIPSAHAKCERCWHYRADVGVDPRHPTICGRCVSNLFGAGEAREFA